MPGNFDARRFVQDFVDALNTKKTDGLLRHYADNAEISDPSTPQPLKGKEGVRRNFETWSSSFSDAAIDVRKVVQTGNEIALLFEARGKHTGTLDLGPGQQIPATNRTVRLTIANFLTLDAQGKIVKDQSIFDTGTMMEQLGLSP